MGFARVLLVEDEEDLSATLVDLLEGEGYCVHAVSRLSEARDALVALSPSAVLVDLVLRDEESSEWLAEIAGKVGVVLFSAASNARLHAERHGVEFVAKPFEVDDLLAAVDRVTRPPADAR